MTPSLTSYPDWKAPAEDGEALIWPEPKTLLQQTLDNHHRLKQASDAKIQGIAFTELRETQRQWLNIAPDRRIIATGHQTELIHPGVWAKNALMHAAAAKIDAENFHFSVDTDAPKHLNLRWPGGSEPITDDPRAVSASWSGLLDGPTPAHLRDITEKFSKAAGEWSFEPMAGQFLDELRRASLEPGKLAPMIVGAMHQIDWSLGLRHHALVVSPIWMSQPYLVFVHHVLARADAFANIYNAALHEYRIAHRLRTTARPMPDLAMQPDQCEVAFWLDDLTTETRSRPSVIKHNDGWKLTLAGEEFLLDPNADGWQAATSLQLFLRRHNVRLSPRALTLTGFIRLFIADQFVHGIGGGRYDQVTDLVTQRFFNIEPPRFSVTTATLFFPAAAGRPRACLPCIAQEGHRLKHRVLGSQKMELVKAIEGLPRKSYDRQRIFSQMHSELAQAMPGHPTLERWQQRLQEATQLSTEEQPLFDRELFYAIQPRGRLMSVIEKYAAAFSL
jgi:hypothetical protein